uniref:WGS project CAEQ00000000 data, annotated contig 1829 n=1 Tax=Trypanosoma congolense (strain IL3000) TaxID=1068625 RepID=F9W968_TRYCI|nr:unnamed protein product [Trypanosoma congolense IL3000]
MNPEPPTKEEKDSRGESTIRVGSQLLLRKVPLLAKARACAQQDPGDPDAECNVLSDGPDVYRICSLISAGNKDHAVFSALPHKRRRDGGEMGDEALDSQLVLPTRMEFLTLLESRLNKSSLPHHSPTEEGEVSEKNLTHSSGKRDVERNDESEAIALRDEKHYHPACGQEERKMLDAIRKPLEGKIAPLFGVENSTGTVSTGGKSMKRVPWEDMFETLMNRSSGAGAEGDAVRSYLRRVSWIAQQKKQQLFLTGAAETLTSDRQSWASMSESARVQKEIMHMRAQRQRFHRERKEK